MLCTKIRLTERRFRIAQESVGSNESGPIVRPCSTRELTECITPRNTRQQRSSHPAQRTPLVVFSLCIAPETKTLAPKVTKRDPRKQPPFCQNFKIPAQTTPRQDDHNRSQMYPELLVRGIEITDKPKTASGDGDNDNGDGGETGGDNQDDCTADDECTCYLQKDLLLNLDGYEMDNFGHLPGDSRTPTPNRGLMLKSNCQIPRDPSPATEQVIRITMNNKDVKSNISKRYRFQ